MMVETRNFRHSFRSFIYFRIRVVERFGFTLGLDDIEDTLKMALRLSMYLSHRSWYGKIGYSFGVLRSSILGKFSEVPISFLFKIVFGVHWFNRALSKCSSMFVNAVPSSEHALLRFLVMINYENYILCNWAYKSSLPHIHSKKLADLSGNPANDVLDHHSSSI